MKTIYEHAVGGDGGMAGAYLDQGMIEVSVKYPVAKIVEPIVAKLDPIKQKIKDLIPGTALDGAVDSIFDELSADITKLLSE